MNACESTIPEEGDTKALTQWSSGSISMTKDPSVNLKSWTPFSIPRFRICSSFEISEVLVATISLPSCLCGILLSEQYLQSNSLPLTHSTAYITPSLKDWWHWTSNYQQSKYYFSTTIMKMIINLIATWIEIRSVGKLVRHMKNTILIYIY